MRFVQGSPNINLGINTADLYIDGHFAGRIPYGAITPFLVSLPVGPHDFKLTQPGTLNPLFLEAIFTLAAGNKYAVVAQGDAAAHTTKLVLFTEPKYNTPSGSFATSYFNASPRAGATTMSYNCITGGPACLNGIGTNSILFHSVNDGWCFAAYNGGGLVVGGSLPLLADPRAGTCATVFLVPTITAPTNNMDLFLVDDVTVPTGSRLLVASSEQNG